MPSCAKPARIPVYIGLFSSGTAQEMMVMPPLKFPAAPRPAMTRPAMNMEDEFARAQIREPSSKRRVKVRYVYCFWWG
jgi:hypothetical protein